MANLFSALNMSSSALKVHQAGISIVSNNISNMNTEGYHKQKLNVRFGQVDGQFDGYKLSLPVKGKSLCCFWSAHFLLRQKQVEHSSTFQRLPQKACHHIFCVCREKNREC